MKTRRPLRLTQLAVIQSIRKGGSPASLGTAKRFGLPPAVRVFKDKRFKRNKLDINSID